MAVEKVHLFEKRYDKETNMWFETPCGRSRVQSSFNLKTTSEEKEVTCKRCLARRARRPYQC